jgi:hypothetical protein
VNRAGPGNHLSALELAGAHFVIAVTSSGAPCESVFIVERAT